MLLLVVVGGLVVVVVVVRLCFWLTTKSITKLPCPPPLPKEERKEGEKEKKGKESCLVTGGLGYLGKELVLELVKSGEYQTIRVLDLSPSLSPPLQDLPIEYFQVDLIAACKREGNHQQHLETALEGVDTVFHIAGIVRLDPQYNLLYNLHVSGTANLLNTCSKKRVSQIVHTSSVAIMVDIHSSNVINADESHPLPEKFASEYAETKAFGEKLYQTHAKNIRHIILRPAPIYGKNDPLLIAPLLRGEIPFLPKGGDRQCWVYIDNAVQAHVKASQALQKQPSLSGNVYFVTDGGPTNSALLIHSLLSLLSSSPPSSLPKSLSSLPSSLPTIPSFIFRGIVAGMEGVGWVTCWRWGRERPFQVTGSALRHITCEYWFKIEAAKKDFGYSPIPTEEGVKKIYQKCLESSKTK